MCDKSFHLLIYHPFLSSVYQGLIHTSLSLTSLDLYHDISIFLMLLGNVLLFLYQFFWHLVIGLHLTTLLKAYITYRCSPVEFHALKYAIISTLVKDTVISFFPISITFSSCFSCFIALAKTSSTVINRYIESRQSCIFPYFSEIVLIFPQFALILAKDCCKMPLLYYCIFLESLITPGLL